MSKPIGHCHCGAVRYAFDWTTVTDPDICHCEDCRRITASPFTAFFVVPETGWRWTGVKPRLYRSSSGVRRWFCETCGTPMAYSTDDLPGETHFYISTLLDPTIIEPVRQSYAAEKVAWIDKALDLPTGD
jgi:hypothetical protein